MKKYYKYVEAQNLQNLYGFSDEEGELAFQLSEAFDMPLKLSFDFLDYYEKQVYAYGGEFLFDYASVEEKLDYLTTKEIDLIRAYIKFPQTTIDELRSFIKELKKYGEDLTLIDKAIFDLYLDFDKKYSGVEWEEYIFCYRDYCRLFPDSTLENFADLFNECCIGNIYDIEYALAQSSEEIYLDDDF